MERDSKASPVFEMQLKMDFSSISRVNDKGTDRERDDKVAKNERN